MEKHQLKAEKRKITGRKVKQLRKKGLLPANVYGKDFKSLSVELPLKEFLKIYEKAGETGIVELKVGQAEPDPVLIHNLQRHPVDSSPLHVDFHRVSLTEKVKTMIPLVCVGEAAAVSQKIGLLLTPVTELEVEALPQDLPEKIEIEVDGLASVGQEIKVKDLKISEKVTLLAEPELVLVKIGELVTEEAKKEMEQEKAAAEAAAAQTAAEKGEAPAEAAPTEPAAKTEEAKPAEEKQEKPTPEEKKSA